MELVWQTSNKDEKEYEPEDYRYLVVHYHSPGLCLFVAIYNFWVDPKHSRD